MAYFVTKTYGHEVGLSACFRQWRANSHCQFLHGYPLSFSFTFGCNHLDENGWVIDFGSLKPVKEWLQDTFDHKTLVATDDPYIYEYLRLNNLGVLDMVEVKGTGCEAFAKKAYDFVNGWLEEQEENKVRKRTWLLKVKVAEHGGNSATYKPFDTIGD